MAHRPNLAFLAIALLSCGAGDEDPPHELGFAADPLAYGEVVDAPTQRSMGLVSLDGCSAALLSPDWVITAGHCVQPEYATSTRAVMSDGQGGELVRYADRVVMLEPRPEHAKGDVGMVHLAGIRPEGWPTEFQRALDDRPVADLVGTSLICYGRGPGSLEDGAWAGYGHWRTGVFAVDGYGMFDEQDVVTFERNAEGQITGPGDSGGPCYAEVGGVLVHAANHSAAGYGVDEYGRVIDSPDMRGYSTATSFYRSWIADVLAQPAYPAMYLRGSMNGWGLHPMDRVHGDVWEAEIELAAGAYEYKYDATGDFLPETNWGDDDNDGKALASGPNLAFYAPVAGSYRFVFDAFAHTYTVVSAQDAVTTVFRVHYDVGWGSYISVRGSVAPLSWSAGQPASWTTGNVWVFATNDIPAGTPFHFKPLRNDRDWSWGADYATIGGQTVDVYPSF